MLKMRSVLMASVCLLPGMVVVPAAMAQPAPASMTPVASGGTIATVNVSGNHRIEASTILAYMVAQPGQSFSQQTINQSVKTLYATGLFQDVTITRQGDDLDVHVVENPMINQILFSGNRGLSDKDAKAAISLQPRSVYTPAAAEAARRALLDAYAKKGFYNAQVTANIIKLPDNRVNLVFLCDEGHSLKISRIVFVGDHHFSQSTLRDVITSREWAWWRFLSGTDVYNAQTVEYDEYQLHKFYFHKGYADFNVVSANANLSPDRKSFYLTFTLDEGQRYKVGTVKIVSSIPHLTEKELRGLVPLAKGDWFDGDALQEGIDALNKRALDLGYAFATVNPQVEPDPKTHRINIILNVINGPRVWIQRIDIVGNTRTEDKVVRRVLTVAAGDAYNQSQIDRSTRNLKNLDFFKDVKLTTMPGSTPQQVILKTSVEEKSTGTFSLGGGYSSSLGAELNTGVSENNFAGTGINTSINAMLAQRGTQVNLGMTDPYFMDRNLIAGWDLFRTVTDSYTNTSQSYSYSESSVGGDVRLGYRFNDNVFQVFTYRASERDIYNIPTGSSANIYVQNEAGKSTLSAISQALNFDYLDNDQTPHSGLTMTISTELAGLGGDAKFLRVTPSATYYIPLERIFGNPSWVLKFGATGGYLLDMRGYQDKIEDRFFLGGDNLRGFADGGVGPYVYPIYNKKNELVSSGGQVGGRYTWTQSTALQFPLPVSPDLGVSGFAFVDVGALWGARSIDGARLRDNDSPRVGAGIGISWNTPFGLIDLSLAQPVVKKRGDQTQQFRISFGSRF